VRSLRWSFGLQGWWLRFKSFFTRGVPAVWPGEYLKAKVGITHERLCEEFHVALFSFQQVRRSPTQHTQ
jgi:hypothetical protein